jgi:hypothetical protein
MAASFKEATMKSLLKMTALAILLTSTSAAWAINKCTAANGTVAFQDAPCEGGKSQTISVKPSSGAATQASANTTPATDVAAVNARSKITAAILAGEPMVGMTAAELERAMGAPTKVNADSYNGIKKDQIIYERVGATWLVYTENGLVTAVQNRPASAAASPVRNVVCPTAHEIRAMETNASSITLSEAVRLEKLRHIGEAKKCGKS